MEKSITPRERFIRTVLGQRTDRGVLWEDRLWAETAHRWKAEGWNGRMDFGFDFLENDTLNCLPVNYGYLPPFREELLEDQGNKKLIRDTYGVVKIVKKGGTGMPQFVHFPVTDRASWEALKERLEPDKPERFGKGWEQSAADAIRRENVPVTLGSGHLCGFFSFLRETAGDECYYLLYDDEELVHDMLAFQEKRILHFIRTVTAKTTVDRLFIWEDMCYNKGPLIGPDAFRKFLAPHYRNVIAAAVKYGIPIVDVDSDGRIDDLLPLWLEVGVNLFHPFEVQSGMDVVRVRKEFGYDFAMRGGVDKRELAKGKDSIDRELERIAPVYQAGRYIPHVDHSVPPDVSFENYCYYIEGLKSLMGIG